MLTEKCPKCGSDYIVDNNFEIYCGNCDYVFGTYCGTDAYYGFEKYSSD